ncbi:MAG TPA: NAD-dependent epimerase/dehydratase family protein [Gemmatimonadales bacterium]|nr:NAD-dependent epimerase/dehydratase family protein [Gemmatimonadales bacterium]
MKVFLTGATGYIGTVVAERLRAAGQQLSGLARSDQAAAKLEAAGVTPIRGDFTNPAAVASGARSANAVISMATTYDPKVDAPAVDAILDALAGTNKPFIYTSGIWVNGDTGGIIVDETTPTEPIELVAWRKLVEDRVLEAAKRGVRSIVIRPAIVYGRGGGIPAGFRDSARKEGAARFVGTGENRWPMVHIDDLADLYLLALERAPAGTLLLAASGPAHPVKDLAAAASRGAGGGGNTAEWAIEDAREELGGAYADALTLDQQASSRRAQELLGWRPHRPGPIEDLESGSYAVGG